MISSVEGVPVEARDSRCGPKSRASRMGAVKLVEISVVISAGVMLLGSNREKHFWTLALMNTVSSLGKASSSDLTWLGSAEKSVISHC